MSKLWARNTALYGFCIQGIASVGNKLHSVGLIRSLKKHKLGVVLKFLLFYDLDLCTHLYKLVVQWDKHGKKSFISEHALHVPLPFTVHMGYQHKEDKTSSKTRFEYMPKVMGNKRLSGKITGYLYLVLTSFKEFILILLDVHVLPYMHSTDGRTRLNVTLLPMKHHLTFI